MKTILHTFLFTTLLAFTTTCTSPANESVRATVLVDFTDDHLYLLDKNALVDQLGLEHDNIWHESSFKVDILGAVPYHVGTDRVEISAGDPFFGSLPARRDSVNAFKKRAYCCLASLDSLPVGHDASSIFIGVSRELNELARCSGSRTLIIYSDMLEHQKNGSSAYDDDFLALMRDSPDSCLKLLGGSPDGIMPLPDRLDGIEVNIICVPDREDLERFHIVSNWYKKILEERGATVHIAGSLKSIRQTCEGCGVIPPQNITNVLPAKRRRRKIALAQTSVNFMSNCTDGDCDDNTGIGVIGIDYNDSTTGQVGGGAINIEETGGFVELESPDLKKAVDEVLMSGSYDKYFVRMILVLGIAIFILAVAINILINTADSIATRIYKFLKSTYGPSETTEDKDGE